MVMTQDEIIEMARQVASHGVENHRSGEVSFVFYNEHLMNFAKLVADKEREACIELIKSHGPTLANGFMLTEAIRARSISRGEA
jgi:hypothetical protein